MKVLDKAATATAAEPARAPMYADSGIARGNHHVAQDNHEFNSLLVPGITLLTPTIDQCR